jgi:hypothetical protein
VFFRPDGEIGDRWRLDLPVVPDAFVQIAIEADSGRDAVHVRCALEVDRGTESLGTLAAKLDAYEEIRASGAPVLGWRDLGLAIVLSGRGQRRSRRVSELVAERWGGWWISWQEEEGPSRCFAELVGTVRPPLTTSPAGKGRVGGVSGSD